MTPKVLNAAFSGKGTPSDHSLPLCLRPVSVSVQQRPAVVIQMKNLQGQEPALHVSMLSERNESSCCPEGVPDELLESYLPRIRLRPPTTRARQQA